MDQNSQQDGSGRFGNCVMATLAVGFLSTCVVLGIRDRFTDKAKPPAPTTNAPVAVISNNVVVPPAP